MSALFATLLLPSPSLKAQEAAPAGSSLDVGLHVSPPFVVEENGDYTGMAVELWEALAAHLDLRTDYRVFATVGELVDAVSNGDVAVGVTNLTITQKRAETIDFTQPWFDAGLRIMVSADRGTGFGEIVAGLRDAGFLTAYAWLVFVIVMATVLLTFFDRRFDKDFPVRWRDGLAESFFAVMSVATSGRTPARKNLFGWLGRIWSALWLVSGIAVLAYVTSTVTSVMTTLSLNNQIDSRDDLPGRDVGVFSGSVAENFAREEGLDFRSYPGIDAAAAALRSGHVDAIVGDAPVLEYYAHTHAEESLDVVGAIFEPDKYGFGLTHDNALTKRVTLELLGARENDLVEELRVKYFGDDP